ncbi:DUF3500 domain-containing protein [Streptomyces sp. ADMS]|uniref:DUF3500 domain-containing protein n=1 Tax=Streptomyces sp. ADMS TaxID=3071415 RepID=UPI00296FA290|nr:DUF3500 domain-containing protein [Streptomyces sp. ADMS]MDW4910210.1 DUF3500 domain-containing protein [Streptomyces sp. ADMS]
MAAADAFLATLSAEQQETVLYDFDDAARKTGWSNFPTPVVKRNGLKLGDLTDEQEAALSEQGYEELVEVRKADDYLASLSADDGGTAPRRPPRPRPRPPPRPALPPEAAPVPRAVAVAPVAPASARSGTTSPSSGGPAGPASSRSSTAATTPPTTSPTPAGTCPSPRP